LPLPLTDLTYELSHPASQDASRLNCEMSVDKLGITLIFLLFSVT